MCLCLNRCVYCSSYELCVSVSVSVCMVIWLISFSLWNGRLEEEQLVSRLGPINTAALGPCTQWSQPG